MSQKYQFRADAPAFIPQPLERGGAEERVSKGDQLIQELASAMTSTVPAKPRRKSPETHHKLIHVQSPGKFPVAGIFCPYCISGAACAFHKGGMQSKVRPMPVLDASSDTQDSEEASTDAGGSEKWCAASDTSDSSSSPQGRKQSQVLKSHSKTLYKSGAVHSKTNDWGDETMTECFSQTVAR